MAEAMKVLWEGLKVRTSFMMFAFVCSAGGTAVAVIVVWAWINVSSVVALALVGLWIVLSLPWLLLLGMILGDAFLFAYSRKIFFLAVIRRAAKQLDRDRMILGREKLHVSRWEKARLVVTLYTNPFIPLGLMSAALLANKQPMEEAVDSFLDEIRRGPGVRSVRDWSIEWDFQIRQHGQGIAA